MDTTYRSAYVYVRDAFAGTLKETDSDYFFLYYEEYLTLCRESYLPIFRQRVSRICYYSFFNFL